MSSAMVNIVSRRYLVLVISFVILTSLPIITATPASSGDSPNHAPSLPGSHDTSLILRSPPSNTSHPNLHPSLLRRHNHSIFILNHLSPSPSLTKRSLAVDLLAAGLRIIFSHLDIAVAAYLEHYRMTDFYKEMVQRMGGENRGGPTVYVHLFTYGFLRFMARYARDEGLTEEMVAEAIIVFAKVMMRVQQFVVVPYEGWLWVENGVRAGWVWIQLQLRGPPEWGTGEPLGRRLIG
ncbi:MAG: hypothetical protein Q9213_003115 [Squamulea squamosa]